MLQTFKLESEFGPATVDGQLIKTVQHETVSGVYTYEFSIPKATIICSVCRGTLREISYQLKSIFPWVRKKQTVKLLEAYGTDGEWRTLNQDRFGKMYRSQGNGYYAAIGKGEKFMDIGSMSFHDAKFSIIS